MTFLENAMQTHPSLHTAPRRAATRPTVVLLHASGGSSRQWNELAEQLQPAFRVCAIDLHGHGAQPAWHGAAPFSLAHEVKLVEPLLREAGRVHLVGHSYGGAVALQLAVAHPGAVASLAAFEPMVYHWLMDAAPAQPRDAPEEQMPARAALSLAGVAHVAGEALLRGAPHDAAQVFVDFWAGAGSWQQMSAGQRDAVAGRMRAVHQQFGAVFRAGLSRSQVARVSAPMLLMSGERTVPVGRHVAAQLRAALPQAEHMTLPGMGHMGPVTHAREVNRRIVDFLHDQGDAALLQPLQRCA